MQFLESERIFKAVRLAERLTERLNAAVERKLSAYFSVNLVLIEEQSNELALKNLLARRGCGSEHVSITHNANRTVGVDVHVTDSIQQIGTGVDYELVRKINPKTARLFLQPAELDWISRTNKAHRNFHLLRLWTIKEALLKSDITNSSAARFLGQYQTDNPQEISGTAHHPDLPHVRFYYATTDFDDGLVSLAVAVKAK